MTARRIVKVGGSLLDLPDLAERLENWLAGQPAVATVLIAGGGKLVDVVRQWQATSHCSDEAAHWLSIDLLGATASMLSLLLPHAPLRMNLGEVDSAPLQILDVRSFLQQDATTKNRLPACWDVTSDTIAARVAMRCEAAELVLLKSTIPSSKSLSEWSKRGFTDALFATTAEHLPLVRAVNLRGAEDECVIAER